jgi:hypothetical protein
MITSVRCPSLFLVILGLCCMLLPWSGHAQVLPPPTTFPVKLVSIHPSMGDTSGVKYTWSYTGAPGTVFCVAFATTNRAVIVSKQWGGRSMRNLAHNDDRYSCATFDEAGQAQVGVDVSTPPSGLLIGTAIVTGGSYHTDVYRMQPKEGP